MVKRKRVESARLVDGDADDDYDHDSDHDEGAIDRHDDDDAFAAAAARFERAHLLPNGSNGNDTLQWQDQLDAYAAEAAAVLQPHTASDVRGGEAMVDYEAMEYPDWGLADEHAYEQRGGTPAPMQFTKVLAQAEQSDDKQTNVRYVAILQAIHRSWMSFLVDRRAYEMRTCTRVVVTSAVSVALRNQQLLATGVGVDELLPLHIHTWQRVFVCSASDSDGQLCPFTFTAEATRMRSGQWVVLVKHGRFYHSHDADESAVSAQSSQLQLVTSQLVDALTGLAPLAVDEELRLLTAYVASLRNRVSVVNGVAPSATTTTTTATATATATATTTATATATTTTKTTIDSRGHIETVQGTPRQRHRQETTPSAVHKTTKQPNALSPPNRKQPRPTRSRIPPAAGVVANQSPRATHKQKRKTSTSVETSIAMPLPHVASADDDTILSTSSRGRISVSEVVPSQQPSKRRRGLEPETASSTTGTTEASAHSAKVARKREKVKKDGTKTVAAADASKAADETHTATRTRRVSSVDSAQVGTSSRTSVSSRKAKANASAASAPQSPASTLTAAADPVRMTLTVSLEDGAKQAAALAARRKQKSRQPQPSAAVDDEPAPEPSDTTQRSRRTTRLSVDTSAVKESASKTTAVAAAGTTRRSPRRSQSPTPQHTTTTLTTESKQPVTPRQTTRPSPAETTAPTATAAVAAVTAESSVRRSPKRALKPPSKRPSVAKPVASVRHAVKPNGPMHAWLSPAKQHPRAATPTSDATTKTLSTPMPARQKIRTLKVVGVKRTKGASDATTMDSDLQVVVPWICPMGQATQDATETNREDDDGDWDVVLVPRASTAAGAAVENPPAAKPKPRLKP